MARLQIRVLVITFEAGPLTQAYIKDTRLAWPLLVDERRKLYEGYGMLSGSPWQIWGPRTWLRYASLLLRGRRWVRPSADPDQLGGDVLIDPDGMVRIHHVGSGPADRPSIQSLLDAVRSTHSDIEA